MSKALSVDLQVRVLAAVAEGLTHRQGVLPASLRTRVCADVAAAQR